MCTEIFTPSECLALLAVLSDACKEVDLLFNISRQNFPVQNSSQSSGRSGQANPDTLLTELNKIFFQTLLRYEKARREDYLELPDGTFRKLNDEESTKVKFIDVVSRVSATLKNLLLEIDESGTITSLERYNGEEQAELEKLETFVNSAAEKERNLVRLQDDVRTLQNELHSQTEKFTQTLEELKHEFQELREMAKMTMQYKTKEYATKLQQEIGGNDKELKALNDEYEHVRAVISQTQRVGEETCSWLYMDIANKVNLADFVPTNDRPKLLQKQVAEMRNTLEARKALHAQLKEEYEKCDSILIADAREKDAIQVREEYAKKFVLAVVQIQSWWRTMIEIRGVKTRRKRKGKGKGKKGKKAA
ncbi:unnamed protein product [Calicophoron daubneyi]|uniref:Dynein regulatory complex protein 10 n=1 Tax=Calicophoron daubneyi TaxID=300641 RepID=A0AAV2T3W8_CALDB